MIPRRLLLAATGLMALIQPALAQPALASEAPPLPARATAHPAQWPAAHSPAAITDPATEARITALLKRMTLAQKIGQMIQGDISSVTPADLQRYPLGSILAGGNSGPYGNERASGAEWARLVGEYRAASAKAGAGIPIVFGVDAVHGHSNLPGATIFPHNIGLGAMHDPALVQRIGAATADEIAATGIEWTFAPTLAVPQDLRWGRSYEGYAADPALVAAWLDLETHLAAADVVITGEGRFDESSFSGKGPGALALRALALGRPVHVFAGQIAPVMPRAGLHLHGITPATVPLEEALRTAGLHLTSALRKAFAESNASG